MTLTTLAIKMQYIIRKTDCKEKENAFIKKS